MLFAYFGVGSEGEAGVGLFVCVCVCVCVCVRKRMLMCQVPNNTAKRKQLICACTLLVCFCCFARRNTFPACSCRTDICAHPSSNADPQHVCQRCCVEMLVRHLV